VSAAYDEADGGLHGQRRRWIRRLALSTPVDPPFDLIVGRDSHDSPLASPGHVIGLIVAQWRDQMSPLASPGHVIGLIVAQWRDQMGPTA
jgi:hypothetical protein